MVRISKAAVERLISEERERNEEPLERQPEQALACLLVLAGADVEAEPPNRASDMYGNGPSQILRLA